MENIFRNHVDAEQSAVCPACGCTLTPTYVRGQMVYRCAPGCAFSGRLVYRERLAASICERGDDPAGERVPPALANARG